jgi:GNAT superfamily N-acetyltransferase
MKIRLASPADAEVIARFNSEMAQETEGRTLDWGRLLTGVRALLNDPGKGFYLLAEQDGMVLGQLMVTYEWSDWRNGQFWWLQGVYVRPESRRQGVFQALFEYVRQQATEQAGICGLRLYVKSGNHRAQDTYRRLGLQRSPYSMYELDLVLPHPPCP